MQQQAPGPQSRQPGLTQAGTRLSRPLPNKKEEGLRILDRIFKRKLRRNFDFL